LAAKPPTDPIPYKENVIICHSERGQEDMWLQCVALLNMKGNWNFITSNILRIYTVFIQFINKTGSIFEYRMNER